MTESFDYQRVNAWPNRGVIGLCAFGSRVSRCLVCLQRAPAIGVTLSFAPDNARRDIVTPKISTC